MKIVWNEIYVVQIDKNTLAPRIVIWTSVAFGFVPPLSLSFFVSTVSHEQSNFKYYLKSEL
jgi:hypothetical protein